MASKIADEVKTVKIVWQHDRNKYWHTGSN